MEANSDLNLIKDLPSELQVAILSVLPHQKIEFLVQRIWNEPYAEIFNDYLDRIGSFRDEFKERAVLGGYEKVDDRFILEHLEEFLRKLEWAIL